ncbi:MAG TPA: hypothetical protein VG759_03870 [Candidatus Angelobacter sp.]|jgi:hypothetical protein|nr:hypothetical protein [Candidatus Angelobacter sp.]
MKLKPYRFWLPATGVSVSALLFVLNRKIYAQGLFNFLNEMINVPAYAMFQLIPCYCGGSVGHYHGGSAPWLKPFLVLSLVAVWWYLVGLELDFQLLRRMAKRLRFLRHCWLVFAAGLQGLVIFVIFAVIFAVIREVAMHTSGKEPVDLVGIFLSVSYVLFLIGWLEAISFRFWRARKRLSGV